MPAESEPKPVKPSLAATLAIKIDGEPYTLTRVKLATHTVWRFQGTDGPPAGYIVTCFGDVLFCSCPDYHYRRHHAGERCKHGEAAQMVGIV